MPPKLISKTPQYLLSYIEHCFKTNKDFIQEDIDWIIFHFCALYSEFIKEPLVLYQTLSLINVKTYCGYFALKFNSDIVKAVKERNGSVFRTLIMNPYYNEIKNNKYLTENELEELYNIYEMEPLVHNLTVKRISVLGESIENYENLYIDSYNEIYTKFFIDKISQNRADFQTLLFLTEYIPKYKNSQVYTYKIIDILKQCITQKFSYDISKNNIELIRNRFSTELKMVHIYLENL